MRQEEPAANAAAQQRERAFEAFALADDHGAFVEGLEIDLRLDFGQLLVVILARHLFEAADEAMGRLRYGGGAIERGVSSWRQGKAQTHLHLLAEVRRGHRAQARNVNDGDRIERSDLRLKQVED